MLTKHTLLPLEFEAVRYSGSSTHAGAIIEWLKGDKPFVNPQVHTRDINQLLLREPDGRITTVFPGDYVIRFLDGTYTVFEASFMKYMKLV